MATYYFYGFIFRKYILEAFMKRVVFLMGIILLAGSALVFAGGNKQSGTAAAGSGPVTIRFSTWDTAVQLATYQTVIDKFMAANPDIIVQAESVPENYEQKLFTAAAAGNAPDVFLWWNYPQLMTGKIIIPLDKYVGTLIDQSLYYPQIFESSKVNGVLYSVPNAPTTRAMFYNKDLFDAAGVAYPTNDWTWDDFVSIAQKLTDPSKTQYGFVTESKNSYTVQQFVWTNGGDFVSQDGKTVSGYMNSPATAEAVQWYADLALKYKISPTPSSSSTMGGPTEMFKTGKVAMIESGLWQLNEFKKIFNVGTCVTPTKNGKRVGVMHSSGLCVYAGTKNVEQAVRFAAEFGGKPGQTEFARLGYGLAEMPSIAQELGTATDPYTKAFYDMIPYCTVKPCFFRTSDWSLIDEKLASAIDIVQSGQATAQKALDDAVTIINQSVQVGK